MRKTASLPQTPNKNGCQKTKNQKKKRGKENGKNKKITIRRFYRKWVLWNTRTAISKSSSKRRAKRAKTLLDHHLDELLKKLMSNPEKLEGLTFDKTLDQEIELAKEKIRVTEPSAVKTKEVTL